MEMSEHDANAKWAKQALWELRLLYDEAGKLGGIEEQVKVLDLFASKLNLKRSQVLLAIKGAIKPDGEPYPQHT